MKKMMRKQEGNIPWTNLWIDLLGAYILTTVILLILAVLLYKFQLSKSMIRAGIIFTYLITCFLAGNLAGRQMKQKRYMWGLFMGVAYYLILVVLTIIVNQAPGAVADTLFTTLILCAGGGMLGGMLS